MIQKKKWRVKIKTVLFSWAGVIYRASIENENLQLPNEKYFDLFISSVAKINCHKDNSLIAYESESTLAKQMYESSLSDSYSQSLSSFRNFCEHCFSKKSEECFSNFYAIFNNDILIAFLNMKIVMQEAEMDYIFVSNDYRRQGLSKLLLTIFEYTAKHMSNCQISKTLLEVGENNSAALSLYIKMGFTKIAVRKKYYKNVEDAFVMEKIL